MELMRFWMVRPPLASKVGPFGRVDVANESAGQEEILVAWRKRDKQKLDELLLGDTASLRVITADSIGDIKYPKELVAKVRQLAKDEVNACVELATELLGMSPDQLINDPSFRTLQSRIENALVGHKIHPEFRATIPTVDLLDACHAAHLVLLLGAYLRELKQRYALGYIRNAILSLPINLPDLSREAEQAVSAFEQEPESLSDEKAFVVLSSLYSRLGEAAVAHLDLVDEEGNAPPIISVSRRFFSDLELAVLEALRINPGTMSLQTFSATVEKRLAVLTLGLERKNASKYSNGSTWMRVGAAGEPSRVVAMGVGAGLKPAGIADLLIVKQHIKRYQGGELAHVENVLDGEERLREHTRKESEEEETIVETESIEEAERDLQSSERSELKSEVSEIVKEDASLKAGASLSASYGPAVEFKAFVEGTTSSSKEEVSRQAASYSKEMTARASSRVSERVLRRRRTRRTLEVLERNLHSFKNSGVGKGNISGLYQWLEKVYECQIFNYGRRVIYDVVVPEPAAYFFHAVKSGADNRPIDLVKPEPFTLQPADLTPWNYGQYVTRYKAREITPPPEMYKVVSQPFRSSETIPANQSRSFSETLKVPDNYMARRGRIVALFTFWNNGNDHAIDMYVGFRTWRRENGSSWSTSFWLNDETASIPIGGVALNVADYAIGFEVVCELSPGGLRGWQQAVHTQLTNAYLSQLSDYERRLEEFVGNSALGALGRSPDENRVLERVELKRLALSVFSGASLARFGAVVDTSNGPEIDQARLPSQAREIRFLEQAFEWEQIQYRFYPFYWGRPTTWLDKILNRDSDPLFRDFLRAGAARIVTPVRPGFEAAVAHYFVTGEVWSGGELPDMQDPEYVPILEEIREAQGQKEAKPYGDAWEVGVPTTLVRLRAKESLPAWERTGEWNWKETS